MIGGGAFSYPKYFSANYPRLQMDVVEIDPKVTQTAKDYFLFVETNNITVYSQDARVYMNNLNKEYDAILMDAFNGYSTPAHLATREYAQLIYNNLSDDGVLVINIPASLSGDYNDFLLSQYKMYQEIFPYADLYTVLFNNKPNDLQNIMLVARKKDIVANREIFEIFQEHRVKETLETGDVVVLTDTYNPTDFLNRKFDSYFDY
jgi:spermidine synthase